MKFWRIDKPININEATLIVSHLEQHHGKDYIPSEALKRILRDRADKPQPFLGEEEKFPGKIMMREVYTDKLHNHIATVVKGMHLGI